MNKHYWFGSIGKRPHCAKCNATLNDDGTATLSDGQVQSIFHPRKLNDESAKRWCSYCKKITPCTEWIIQQSVQEMWKNSTSWNYYQIVSKIVTQCNNCVVNIHRFDAITYEYKKRNFLFPL